MTFSYGLLLLLSHCDIVKQICDQFHERVPRTAESDQANGLKYQYVPGCSCYPRPLKMGQIELQGGKGRAQQEDAAAEDFHPRPMLRSRLYPW